MVYHLLTYHPHIQHDNSNNLVEKLNLDFLNLIYFLHYYMQSRQHKTLSDNPDIFKSNISYRNILFIFITNILMLNIFMKDMNSICNDQI